MISKKILMGVISLTLLTLIACNNDANNAFDDNTKDNINNTLNTLNRDNNNNNDNNANDIGNNINQALNNMWDNNKRDRNADDDNSDLNISSDITNIPSQQYPQTEAVLIRDAQYKYVVIDPNRIRGNQTNVPVQPGTQQQPTNPPAQNQRQQQTAPNAQSKTQPTKGISQITTRVVELTNVQRRKNGLPDLKIDTSLSKVAQTKSNDMQKNQYFSHTSPTYGSPFDMMRDFGINYRAAGENIAQGQPTPEEVVTAWMNSEGHRRNILNRDFTHIGVGYEQSGKHWTQMFIGK